MFIYNLISSNTKLQQFNSMGICVQLLTNFFHLLLFFSLYTVVTFTMSMTAYALCLLDWHDPKAGNAIYLLVFLTIVTFVMVIVTIRTVYQRWRKASTQEFCSEV